MAPTVLAAVRRRPIAWPVGPHIRPLFDQVWSFLRAPGAPVKPAGHNVCIYHSPTKVGCELEVGVQVSGRFEDAGEIVCSSTPSGLAACATHWGSYDGLGKTYDVLRAWCHANGYAGAGAEWEVYGDWADDPKDLRTDLHLLVRPR